MEPIVAIPGCRIPSPTSAGRGWRLRLGSKRRVSYVPSPVATSAACIPRSATPLVNPGDLIERVVDGGRGVDGDDQPGAHERQADRRRVGDQAKPKTR